MRAMNIFEVINQNIVTVSEDVHTMMGQVNGLAERISQLEKIFAAPDEPNVHGAEGVEGVSSGQ